MNKFMAIPAALMIMATVVSCEGTKVQNVKLETAADSLSYAIGVNIGESFKEQKLTEVDPEIMAAVINAIINDDTAALKMTNETSITFIQAYMGKKAEQEAAKELEEGKKWMEDNAKKTGVIVTPSGLQYQVLASGSGISPVDGDEVTVHYTGKFTDGEVFDSSIESGQPVTFPINGVIKGWTEALKMMKEGDKWMLYIPTELAWGPSGFQGVVPPNANVIFEVELIKVNKAGTDD